MADATDATNAFSGDITLEGIAETIFANLEVKEGDKDPIRVLGVYVKNADGKEYRFYLGGDQPVQWINSLLQVTGARLSQNTPQEQPK